MKKNIWMVLAAASLMTACDYNEKYFEGFDETDQSNVQKYTVEYTEKTFKETESAKDVIIPWLTQKYYTCDNGSFASVSYMQETTEIKEVPVLEQDFERNVVDKEATDVAGWLNYSVKGTAPWYDKAYSNNVYTECSAYKADGEVQSWIISPKFKAEVGDVFSFDVCIGNYKGDALKVYVFSTFQGNSGSITNKYTEWEDVTDNFSIPQEPVKGYGSMARAGSMKLDEFAGKNIYIAFVYEGAPDGVTTSVQIDNVLVMRNESETIVNKEVDEYDYKENEWVFKRTVPSGLLFETITMQKEDFQLVVDYVAANFDEGYLDTQKVGQGEYYYGASSAYGNWNAKGYTRKKYYDVTGAMANLTTDEEMDAYCIEQVKLGLVKFIELVHPEPVFVDGQVTNYKVISSIYTSTGTASYVAKIVWSEEESRFVLESLDEAE